MKKFIGVVFCLTLLSCFSGQLFAAETYFSETEMQLHFDPSRDTGGDDTSDILTLTAEHASEWKYGDNYFFLDVEGKEDYSTDTNATYFEYAPRFSINNIFGIPTSGGFLGEFYATVQYNAGTFANSTLLYGVSVDFNFQPNYGFSNLSLLYRDEDTQDASYQVTFVWGQPFTIGNLNMAFNGFIDVWQNDDCTVFLTEPQIRLNLSSFVEPGDFLADSAVGMEFEISSDFFGKDAGTIVNPTIFFATSL